MLDKVRNIFSGPRTESGPPSFIIIVADDLGYGDVGCYGAREINTPNLDQLAAEGTRFTSYYSGGLNCTGGRAALLTGCYPGRIGLGGKNIPPGSSLGLNPAERTLPKVLNEAGYVNGYIGKWSLGSDPALMPRYHGFDYFLGIPFSHSYLFPEAEEMVYQVGSLPLMDNETELEENPDPARFIQLFTEQAAEFIESAGDQPFCLVVSHALPHRPIAVSEEFEGRSRYGPYGDVVEAIDWSVGALRSVLQGLEREANTAIFFTSDNGPATQSEEVLGYRGGTARPFRGGKNQTLEGGMRVPFIAHWPGHLTAGKLSHDIVCGMDLLPTIAALAGVQLAPKPVIDGKNLVPLLTGEKLAEPPHSHFFFYRDNRLQAVREGPWKLVVYRSEWNLEKPAKKDYLLFNLETDPTEESDVAAENPALVEQLAKLADRARRDLGDEVHNRKGANVRPVGDVMMMTLAPEAEEAVPEEQPEETAADGL